MGEGTILQFHLLAFLRARLNFDSCCAGGAMKEFVDGSPGGGAYMGD